MLGGSSTQSHSYGNTSNIRINPIQEIVRYFDSLTLWVELKQIAGAQKKQQISTGLHFTEYALRRQSPRFS